MAPDLLYPHVAGLLRGGQLPTLSVRIALRIGYYSRCHCFSQGLLEGLFSLVEQIYEWPGCFAASLAWILCWLALACPDFSDILKVTTHNRSV